MHVRLARAARAAAAACLVLVLGPAAGAGEATPDWMTYDAASKTVKMTVVAGQVPSVNGGWNFNGYANGDMTITVPLGSTIDMDFKNVDQLQHSLVVISGEAPLPPQGGDPVFPRAFTVKKVEGIPPEGGDKVRFKADRTGKYRIFCGVAGHGLAGMWDWLVVSADAQAPSVSTTRRASGAETAPPAALAIDGHAWVRMSEGEKLRYLEGFLAGQAVRQAAERLGGAPEPAAVAAALAALRREGALAYPFSPTVYKTRLEDFFFYHDRRSMPLYAALAAVNAQLRSGNAPREAGPGQSPARGQGRP